MTVDERLGRIDERLEHLEHELLGNGQPGIIAAHEKRLKSLETESASWRANVKLSAWLVSLLLTLTAIAVAWMKA